MPRFKSVTYGRNSIINICTNSWNNITEILEKSSTLSIWQGCLTTTYSLENWDFSVKWIWTIRFLSYIDILYIIWSQIEFTFRISKFQFQKLITLEIPRALTVRFSKLGVAPLIIETPNICLNRSCLDWAIERTVLFWVNCEMRFVTPVKRFTFDVDQKHNMKK